MRDTSVRVPTAVCRSQRHSWTLFGRSSRIDGHEVRAFAVALVFEHPKERSPRRSGAVAAVRGEFHQPLRVEVFDRYEVVFPGVVVRELVQEVPTLPLQVGVASGDDALLRAVVGRAVFLPRACVVRVLTVRVRRLGRGLRRRSRRCRERTSGYPRRFRCISRDSRASVTRRSRFRFRGRRTTRRSVPA